MTRARGASPPSASAAPPGWTGVALPVALTLAVQALTSMNVVAIAVLMPVASVDIGVSPGFVGVAMALVYTGSMVSALVSGDAITRGGPIGVSQLCLLLCLAGLAAFAVPGVAMAVLGVLVMGLGYGPVTPASSHILIRTTPPSILSMVFSIKQTGVPLGGALAGAIIPWLVLACGWQWAALLAGGASAVLALLLVPYRTRYDTERSSPPRLSMRNAFAPLKMVLVHRGLRRISIAATFYSIMQLSLISFLVTYVIQEVGMSLVDAGLLLSAAQGCGVGGRILWGVLSDRSGRPLQVLGVLGIVMGAGAVLAAAFSPAWPYAALVAVSGVFGSSAIGWNGVFIAEIARIATPSHAGAATGGSLFLTFLGILLALPAFAGIASLTGSYSTAFVAVAVTTSASGVWLCLTRTHR